MSVQIQIKVTRDDVTGSLEEIEKFSRAPAVKKRMADNAATLTRSHILALGPNKQGWPSTGFYKAVAKSGVTWQPTEEGFRLLIDHPTIPGAMTQRYYGGTINMKDKLLTIPARQEFYGHRAGEFTGLRFGMFRNTGTKFLYILKGGAEREYTKTTKTKGGGKKTRTVRTNRGMGARAEMMIAYWLKESVDQDPNENVIPTIEDYSQVIMTTLLEYYDQFIKKRAARN